MSDHILFQLESASHAESFETEREKQGIIPNSVYHLSHLGLLSFHGDHVATFLQGQMTCDVHTITSQQFRPFAIPKPNGRVFANGLLFLRNDLFYAIAPKTMIHPIKNHLQLFARFSKITIQEESGELFGHYSSTITQPPLTTQTTDKATILTLTDPTRQLSVCSDFSFTDFSPLEQWQWMDVQSLWTWITPKIREQVLPQTLNLEAIQGLSFKKGCYVGQEIIARTQFRGTIKRHLHLGSISAFAESNAVAPGSSLVDTHQQPVGLILNVCKAPTEMKLWCLAVIEDRALGTPLLILGPHQGKQDHIAD